MVILESVKASPLTLPNNGGQWLIATGKAEAG